MLDYSGYSENGWDIMQEKIILSTVSAWELGDKFETTKAQKNEALREAQIAKQDGDLSENAPYQAAKEKFRTMGRIQRRLRVDQRQSRTAASSQKSVGRPAYLGGEHNIPGMNASRSGKFRHPPCALTGTVRRADRFC